MYFFQFQASTSLPQAILASEDPASEEESGENVTPADESKLGEHENQKEKKEMAQKEKSANGKPDTKSGGKKSKNSYSIAALCQVRIII